ncbi:MAG: hypothetical protein P8X60_10525 [Robiginitalea sp.]|jgi:hypothetical protein
MLDRLDVEGWVLLEGLVVCLLGGLAAGLLDGREVFIDDLDMELLEARWPIRCASI